MIHYKISVKKLLPRSQINLLLFVSAKKLKQIKFGECLLLFTSEPFVFSSFTYV